MGIHRRQLIVRGSQWAGAAGLGATGLVRAAPAAPPDAATDAVAHAASAAAQARPSPPACPDQPRPVASTNGKFAVDGRALYYPGCTIVCQVAQFTPLSERLVSIRNRLQAVPYRDKLAILPPSSYHMTVCAVDSPGQRISGNWYEGLALDAEARHVARTLATRLQGLELDYQLPLRLRVRTEGRPRLSGIALRPVDAAESDKLQLLREQLMQALRFRMQTPQTYEFHITLLYLLEPLSAAERAQHLELMGQACAELRAALPVLALGAPEFCHFQDMHAFDHQFFLAPKART